MKNKSYKSSFKLKKTTKNSDKIKVAIRIRPPLYQEIHQLNKFSRSN